MIKFVIISELFLIWGPKCMVYTLVSFMENIYKLTLIIKFIVSELFLILPPKCVVHSSKWTKFYGKYL